MFTGIIEFMDTVVKVEKNKGNLDISLKSGITNELKIDQSLCHNGVCLTVVDIDNDVYTVNVISDFCTVINFCRKETFNILSDFIFYVATTKNNKFRFCLF